MKHKTLYSDALLLTLIWMMTALLGIIFLFFSMQEELSELYFALFFFALLIPVIWINYFLFENIFLSYSETEIILGKKNSTIKYEITDLVKVREEFNFGRFVLYFKNGCSHTFFVTRKEKKEKLKSALSDISNNRKKLNFYKKIHYKEIYGKELFF